MTAAVDTDVKTSDIVKTWSPLLLSLIGMAVAYGAFSQKITNQEASLGRLEQQMTTLQQQLVTSSTPMITDIASLKAEQVAQQRETSELKDFIARRMDRLEAKMDDKRR